MAYYQKVRIARKCHNHTLQTTQGTFRQKIVDFMRNLICQGHAVHV